VLVCSILNAFISNIKLEKSTSRSFSSPADGYCQDMSKSEMKSLLAFLIDEIKQDNAAGYYKMSPLKNKMAKISAPESEMIKTDNSLVGFLQIDDINYCKRRKLCCFAVDTPDAPSLPLPAADSDAGDASSTDPSNAEGIVEGALEPSSAPESSKRRSNRCFIRSLFYLVPLYQPSG